MKSLLAAIAFLTRIPVARLVTFDAGDVARSAGWFPLVGVVLGAIAVGVARLFEGRLPVELIAVLLMAVEALATGALHFDGLADTADGFGGGKDREDILRIMRDHAIGSYGGTALVILVALKVTAYAALLKQSDWIPALLLTPALGRWAILLLTAALPYARTSASVVKGMDKRSLFWGSLLLAAALAATRSVRGAIATAAVVGVSAAFGFYSKRKIGGITGDTLGANVQLCESAALLTFLWAGLPR